MPYAIRSRIACLVALLAIVARAAAFSIEKCEVRDVAMENPTESGVEVLHIGVFHCTTDEDLYVKSTVNASMPPILLTSTGEQVRQAAASVPEIRDQPKANFAGAKPNMPNI